MPKTKSHLVSQPRSVDITTLRQNVAHILKIKPFQKTISEQASWNSLRESACYSDFILMKIFTLLKALEKKDISPPSITGTPEGLYNAFELEQHLN